METYKNIRKESVEIAKMSYDYLENAYIYFEKRRKKLIDLNRISNEELLKLSVLIATLKTELNRRSDHTPVDIEQEKMICPSCNRSLMTMRIGIVFESMSGYHMKIRGVFYFDKGFKKEFDVLKVRKILNYFCPGCKKDLPKEYNDRIEKRINAMLIMDKLT